MHGATTDAHNKFICVLCGNFIFEIIFARYFAIVYQAPVLSTLLFSKIYTQVLDKMQTYLKIDKKDHYFLINEPYKSFKHVMMIRI